LPVIPALGRLRHKFEASLHYIVRPCSNIPHHAKKQNPEEKNAMFYGSIYVTGPEKAKP
jgi:hypothetical protein